MYKVKWDQDSNGILLDDKIERSEEIVPPRPVFHEELTVLGFDQYWTYPESERPLLWSNGRTYYSHGIPVAEAQGGNLYERPKLIVHEKGLQIKPIDMQRVVARNKEALSICENEAKDFVQSTYKKYARKVDYLTVAFSGGKDSQVVLDIVSQILAPDEYIVVFTDTTMELPFTYDTVETTQNFYKRQYPEMRFYNAKPPQDSHDFWEIVGPPSRLHRWCCSVCKTAPFTKRIKELHKEKGNDGMPKLLVFEGVRADESNRRSLYTRIVSGAKHARQRNARVIFHWNVSEIFLYLFQKKIELNEGYRHGLHRVGCSICPFSSRWSEFILMSRFPEFSGSFVEIIKSTLKNSGMHDEKKIKQYLSEGQWKKRGGGKYIISNETRVDFVQQNKSFKAVIHNPREVFLEWLHVIGDSLYTSKDFQILGEVRINNDTYEFEFEQRSDNAQVINFPNIGSNIIAQSRLKKIIYKTAFCVHCGACEAECPVDALQVIPKVKVDRSQCIHCLNCLNFVEKGCLVAKSLTESEGKGMESKKTSNPDRYSGFGIREEWLASFFHKPETWIEENPLALGQKQVPAMKRWLKEAGLLDEKDNTPTKMTYILKSIKSSNPLLLWELIWIELSFNSPVVEWYSETKPGTYTKNELKELIKKDFPEHRERTLSNAIDALTNMLDYSPPLGKDLGLGIIAKKGKSIKSITKTGTDDIHSIAVAYNLYKLAEKNQRYQFTVSEFYEDDNANTPYKILGIPKENFENILRYLQEEKNQVVRVDLQADLENVFLREDLGPVDILEMLRADL